MKFKYLEDGPKRSKGAGSSKYLRLKSGESVIGLLRGEIYEFFQVFENGKGRNVPHGTRGAKQRFKINIVVKENGQNTVKIFEFGRPVNNKLFILSKEHDLTKSFVKITREGERLDTVWFVEMVSIKPSEATLAALNQLPLNILEPQDHVEPEMDPFYEQQASLVKPGKVPANFNGKDYVNDVPLPETEYAPTVNPEDDPNYLPF